MRCINMENINSINLKRFNKRRASRGADAAEFEIQYSTGNSEIIWMSKIDIRRNIAMYPEHKNELEKGLNQYG